MNDDFKKPLLIDEHFSSDMLYGLGYYLATSVFVLSAILFAQHFLVVARPKTDSMETRSLSEGFISHDGLHYLEIVESGYSYSRHERSSIAFFPAYPIAAKLLASVFNLDSPLALIVTANLFCSISFILFSRYCRLLEMGRREVNIVLLAYGLFPATLFFRMAYSESMFICILLLILILLRVESFHRVVVAFLVGMITGVRPVGVAVVVGYVAYLVRGIRLRHFRVRDLFVCIPISCWGIGAFSIYQTIVFSDALAFLSTQQFWHLTPSVSHFEKLVKLCTLEPLWGTYLPSSIYYWRRYDSTNNILFSLTVVNPIIFGLAAYTIYFSYRAKLIKLHECVCFACLLAIPYLTRAHEMAMCSHARFSILIPPLYVVLGRQLFQADMGLGYLVVGAFAVMLCYYTALFSVGYMIF